MPQTKGKGKGRGKRKDKAAQPDRTKNQYEIWAEFTNSLAELMSKEAQRMKTLASKRAPGKADYTVGDYLLDQMRNRTKLLEAYNEASKKA